MKEICVTFMVEKICKDSLINSNIPTHLKNCVVSITKDIVVECGGLGPYLYPCDWI
jgi:hypothetical protein